MWGSAVGLFPRLALPVLAGAGRFCILGSGAATRRDLKASNRRGFSDSYPQLLPAPDFRESPAWVPNSRSELKRYVTSRRLAETLVQILRGKRKTRHLILECNPGPGILTQALLETGATVVAFESDRTFIPHLESLRKNVDGKLEVVRCDFFKMHSGIFEPERTPLTVAHMLFQNLGIEALPWSAGIPLKVIGIFPIKSERKALWKLLHDLYSCSTIYRFGRVELNLFISEKEYQKLKANPRKPDLYHVLSVLWQVACEIKLLHMEPWSSFDVYSQNGQLENPRRSRELSQLIQQNQYFIRMTPRRDLFTENLTPINYDVFFHLVKHCFGKRSAKLMHHLHSLSPLDAKGVLKQTKKKGKMQITKMYPQDFKRLFEAIECSEDCGYKWIYDGSMDDGMVGP